ncbi:MAG: NUDIX hydrolase [Solirubrobacterales bacterium]|nr:NUDIX hydrolase [Solirubrobacterales bacterium]
MTDDRTFTRLGGRSIYKGRIIDVRVERYRYADGEEAEREIVRHQGAAAVVPVDDEHVWLVRQPREPVDDPDSLELPAGRLDVEGEPPLDAAKRELAEEIGKQSPSWSPLTAYRSSVGFTDEVVHVFLAEDVRDVPGAKPEAEHNERIEVVPWPLDRLGELIEQVTDAKTLIGLLLLDRRRRG